MNSRPRTLFDDHMDALRSAGEEETPKNRYQAKQSLLRDMTAGLSKASPDELLAYGESMSAAIDEHESRDSLATARTEGRLIYRSWAGSEAGEELDGGPGHYNHFGKNSLDDLLDPTKFKEHKKEVKEGKRNVHYASAPSSLAKKEGPTTVFSDDNATVAALLPENHYAAFFAFNEAAKEMERVNIFEQGGQKSPAANVGTQARDLRARITRPEFFDNVDLGTSVGAQAPDNPKHPKPRRLHSESPEDVPSYKTTGEQKLGDEKRVQAIFYSSFIDTQYTVPNQHNEMTVKYRQSGHLSSFEKGGEHSSGLITEGGHGGRGGGLPTQLTIFKEVKHPRINK